MVGPSCYSLFVDSLLVVACWLMVTVRSLRRGPANGGIGGQACHLSMSDVSGASCVCAAVAGSAFTLRERRGLGAEKPDAVMQRGHAFEHSGFAGIEFISGLDIKSLWLEISGGVRQRCCRPWSASQATIHSLWR